MRLGRLKCNGLVGKGQSTNCILKHSNKALIDGMVHQSMPLFVIKQFVDYLMPSEVIEKRRSL